MKKILLCLDSDPQPSVFDSVVAIDAGVDHLLRHGRVEASDVRDLVHGAMFTRGGDKLCNTALFIGGSDVEAGERLLAAAQACFFGPVRVSMMLDPNGANTTAAAAVLAAAKHLSFGPETVAVVLGATGPVGQRVVRLLAHQGVKVRVVSRKIDRAQTVCDRVAISVPQATLSAHATDGPPAADGYSRGDILDGAQLVFATGAIGVELLSDTERQAAKSLAVAIDLNAVPPAGIGGVEPQDKAVERNGQCCYGALGIGGMKMKIHKVAITQLFTRNDLVLDAEEIYEIGKVMNDT